MSNNLLVPCEFELERVHTVNIRIGKAVKNSQYGLFKSLFMTFQQNLYELKRNCKKERGFIYKSSIKSCLSLYLSISFVILECDTNDSVLTINISDKYFEKDFIKSKTFSSFYKKSVLIADFIMFYFFLNKKITSPPFCGLFFICKLDKYLKKEMLCQSVFD